MRLHALLLALFVLAARAATIPDKTEVDFEKKLTEAVKEVVSTEEKPAENTSSEQELIDQANVVKDVENNLRKQIVDIPVKVVVDDKNVVKTADKKEDNEIIAESDENIEREEIDVKNPPGPPQRQVHDTQSPEHFEDAKAKQAASTDNQNQIQNQGPLANVQQNLNNWISNNQQIQKLQQSIKDFQDNFNKQVGSIANIVKNVLQGNINPLQPQTYPVDVNAPVSGKPDSPNEDKKPVGLRSAAVLKEEGGSGSSSSGSGTPSEGNESDKPWWQQIQSTISNMQTQLANLSQQFQEFNQQQQQQQQTQQGSQEASSGGFFQNIQNIGSSIPFFNQNQPNATQSDEPQKPSSGPGAIWQNIQNFFQGSPQPPQNAQSDSQQPAAQPNRPIIQAVQNAIGSFWRPGQSEPQKPSNPEKPVASQEGANAVPEKPASQPAEAQKEPETATLPPSGPIKQLIAQSPVVQGIAGAVQKIQHSIKPEQPRDTVKGEENDVKGLLLKPGHIKPGFKPGHEYKPGHNPESGSVGLSNGGVTGPTGNTGHSSGGAAGSTRNIGGSDGVEPNKEPQKEPETAAATDEKAPEVPQKTE